MFASSDDQITSPHHTRTILYNSGVTASIQTA